MGVSRLRIIAAGLMLLCCAAPAVRAKSSAAELVVQYDKLSQEFAAANPDWRPKAPASGSLLFVASDEYSPLAKSVEAAGEDRLEARRKYADAVFDLAKQAAEAGQLSLAFEWATEAVRENPDHADARRVLGYEKKDDEWLTAYGIKMRDAGKSWDPQSGWLDSRDSITAQRELRKGKADAARKVDIKNGWTVRTDHFLVTTDHSLTAGAELASRLERLYQVWRQLFAGFFYSEKEVQALFAGERNARTQPKPFRVFYYRDRDEYVNTLLKRQSRIAETLGIYFDTFREAHFFAVGEAKGDKSDDSTRGLTAERAVGTLYHEAVHQLFQETKPTAKHVGSVANFWAIEGVATYFETLTEHNDAQAGLYFTIGDSAAGRLPSARRNASEGFYIQLAELTALNKDEMQRHANLAKLYSQSCGLAAFLLDGERGRYREPLVSYLQAIYAGRDDKASLSAATGKGFTELDAEYRRFLESLP